MLKRYKIMNDEEKMSRETMMLFLSMEELRTID